MKAVYEQEHVIWTNMNNIKAVFTCCAYSLLYKVSFIIRKLCTHRYIVEWTQKLTFYLRFLTALQPAFPCVLTPEQMRH